jgi:hypothetical protein
MAKNWRVNDRSKALHHPGIQSGAQAKNKTHPSIVQPEVESDSSDNSVIIVNSPQQTSTFSEWNLYRPDSAEQPNESDIEQWSKDLKPEINITKRTDTKDLDSCVFDISIKDGKKNISFTVGEGGNMKKSDLSATQSSPQTINQRPQVVSSHIQQITTMPGNKSVSGQTQRPETPEPDEAPIFGKYCAKTEKKVAEFRANPPSTFFGHPISKFPGLFNTPSQVSKDTRQIVIKHPVSGVKVTQATATKSSSAELIEKKGVQLTRSKMTVVNIPPVDISVNVATTRCHTSGSFQQTDQQMSGNVQFIPPGRVYMPQTSYRATFPPNQVCQTQSLPAYPSHHPWEYAAPQHGTFHNVVPLYSASSTPNRHYTPSVYQQHQPIRHQQPLHPDNVGACIVQYPPSYNHGVPNYNLPPSTPSANSFSPMSINHLPLPVSLEPTHQQSQYFHQAASHTQTPNLKRGQKQQLLSGRKRQKINNCYSR